jgi:excisionase family DNA binding protein
MEIAMSSLPPTRGALLRSNATSLIPDAHEIELAAQSQSALRPLAEATGDLTVVLSGEGGSTGEILIPASAVRLLFAALAQMACGRGISLLPLDAELRTQEAADLLNVSRPYLVGLLERGEMPFRLVGNQRRIKLRDLIIYKTHSDVERRAALTELAHLGQEIGVGYEA